MALIDAGSKVFSSDKVGDEPYARPLDGRDFAVTRLSEEHGFLTGSDVDELEIGQVLQMIPLHVCPVVNLSEGLLRGDAGEMISVLAVEGRGCVT